MPSLFPRWSNTALSLGLVSAALGALAVPAAAMIYVRTPYAQRRGDQRDQPVQFDHRHHVRDAGIDCLYCHAPAERSRHAGVPPTSLCMNCHSQVWNQSPLLEPVRHSLATNIPIAWSRVNGLPDFVAFDHSIHVAKGVGCATCHGRVDLMARVYQAEPLTMQWCLDCHREPERHLRPPEHITDMEYSAGDRQLAVGHAVKTSLHVEPPTHCSACHY